ncbi:MAG: hypothetical protein JXR91_05245 [Deltaproteobacteria bacterium]|nr:hypothetical protein [Deltaproteobacteria bacterium]
MKKLTLIFMALLLSVSVASCKDDSGDGGGTTVNTGLPEDKIVSDLTDDEVYKACVAITKLVNSTADDTELLCKSEALMTVGMSYMVLGEFMTDDAMVTTCDEAYKACMDAPATDDATTPEEECAGSSTEDIPANCNATVGEIENCLSDYNKLAADSIPDLPSCSSLTSEKLIELSASYGDMQTEPEPPASCDVVNEKCPGFLEEMTGGGFSDTDMGYGDTSGWGFDTSMFDTAWSFGTDDWGFDTSGWVFDTDLMYDTDTATPAM